LEQPTTLARHPQTAGSSLTDAQWSAVADAVALAARPGASRSAPKHLAGGGVAPTGWRLRLALGDLGLRLQPGKPQRPYIVANDSHRHARGDDTSASSPLRTPDGHPPRVWGRHSRTSFRRPGANRPRELRCRGFASVPPNRRRAVRADTGRVRWDLLGTAARRACHRGARPAAGRHQVRGRGERRAGRAPAKAERLRRIGLGWRLGTRRGGMPLTRTGATETAGALAGGPAGAAACGIPSGFVVHAVLPRSRALRPSRCQ
jgi:hypothetical protein